MHILDLILTTIYLQSNGNQEIGIGENSRPKRKDHHDKLISNFVDVIKVAHSQHIKSQTLCIEISGHNPLPQTLLQYFTLITIILATQLQKAKSQYQNTNT